MIDPTCMEIRREHFPATIAFHAPGFKRYQTSEFQPTAGPEFVSISLTGTNCALQCDHCRTLMLRGMLDLPKHGGSLFGLCQDLASKGVRGVLVSGGSDLKGRVPLLLHIPDLVRARRELGLSISVHPGLPDDETCAALAEVGCEAVMVDIIGETETIRSVYHLDATPQTYTEVLARLEKYALPAVPHVVVGLHYGKLVGEWKALEMIASHPCKMLVIVALNPLESTPAGSAVLADVAEIGAFFEFARKSFPDTSILLGCARPPALKADLEKLAIQAGFNGIAYPSEGTVAYAIANGLVPEFNHSCCGVSLRVSLSPLG